MLANTPQAQLPLLAPAHNPTQPAWLSFRTDHFNTLRASTTSVDFFASFLYLKRERNKGEISISPAINDLYVRTCCADFL